MWINEIAGVVTELHRSGRMAGFGGWSWGAGVLIGFGGVLCAWDTVTCPIDRR
jgi:hypothetical protein